MICVMRLSSSSESLLAFVICSIWGGIAWTWPIYFLLALAFAARRISYAPEFAPARATDDTVVDPMPQPAPQPALAGG